MLKTYWADLLDPKDPLMSFRKKSWDLFEQIGLPQPKQEAFQYLLKKEFSFPALAERKEKRPFSQEGLLFVDGFLQESRVPAPLVCMPLESAMRSYGLFLQNRLAKMIQEETDPFAALNGAFQGGGAFLYVPPKCKAALHVRYVNTGPEMASPRLHLYLGRNAQIEIIQTSEGKSGFCNRVLDFVLDEGAQLHFSDRAQGDFQALRVLQKRDSQFKSILVGKNVRTSIKVQLAEENSEGELLGLTRLEGEEESHVHATFEHMAPHTRSRQHFKSVLKDLGRFSFEGKIRVSPEAQKTEAYQLNNNLLLSDRASANAKPNLEIFADDVKASHGATIGQLDEEQLFYLRSRGLGLEQAKDFLIQGFCKEILDHAR